MRALRPARNLRQPLAVQRHGAPAAPTRPPHGALLPGGLGTPHRVYPQPVSAHAKARRVASLPMHSAPARHIACDAQGANHYD